MSPTVCDRIGTRSRTLAVLLLAVVASILLVNICSDGSDAATSHASGVTVGLGTYTEIDLSDHMGGDTYRYTNYDRYSSASDLPPGMTRDGSIISGTPSEVGTYTVGFRFHDSVVALTYDAYLVLTITVVDGPETFTVTYDAGVGTVGGSRYLHESIVEGTYASLPDALHATGAYTFLGWSVSKTSPTILKSYTVDSDVTLHAVWERNTVSVGDRDATVSVDQSVRVTLTTDPAEASVRIVSYGGLNTYNAYTDASDDHVVILDMTGVSPGRYTVTIQVSYTGYITGTGEITVDVPIDIVEPVEYTLAKGDVFVHRPVTNPANATITIVSVELDGTPLTDHGGISVEDGTITGTFDDLGTYEVIYKASMDGYVDVVEGVMVMVTEPSGDGDPVSLASVAASKRAGAGLTYDLVAIGGANVSNYVWSVDGEVFASSSPTALVTFPSPGLYTVTCTAHGHDGGSVSVDLTVMCDDNRHRDAAWNGVEYGYVVEGEHDMVITDGSPFSVSVEDIDGRTYTVVSGTPSDTHVGSVFTVTVGDDVWDITVYEAEDTAPTSSFDIGIDGLTVTAAFTGSHASFHLFDFDGDGVPEDGDAYTYQNPGRYVISCTAVNNVSEVTSVVTVGVGVGDGVHTPVSVLDDLTDFSMMVGDRLYIDLPFGDGSVAGVAIGGTASAFAVYADGSILLEPSDTGVFDLTVTITGHDSSVQTRTVEVTVTERPVPPISDDDGGRDTYMGVMAVLFVIGVLGVGAFLFLDTGRMDRGGRRE